MRCVATIGRAPNGKVDYKRHRAESMERDRGARRIEPERPLGQTEAMFIAPVDATRGEGEWRPFVEAHPFGHLVAPGGTERELPVVVPTQFVLAGDTVWLHLVRANPVFEALAENPRVLLSVADDWAFIPSAWKAIGDEDPALGIPTTYYGAVQLVGTATVHDERTAPGQRGRHPAAPAGGVPARRRRGRPRRGPRGEAARDPRRSRSASSRCRPSSSTAATSTRPTGGPWWSGCAAGAGRATRPRPATSCGGCSRVGAGHVRRATRRRRPGWPASSPSPSRRARRCGRP